MNDIPKIIHQIWSGVDEPLPEHLRTLGETWKEHHPDWSYEFWDNNRITSFIKQYYPNYWDVYCSFQYNIQRWDAIRYLILDKIGGMYVDFDTECLASHNDLLKGKTCCFSMEPKEHAKPFNCDFFFNNALMASVPEHPFMKKIVNTVFKYKRPNTEVSSWTKRVLEIFLTTGPLLLIRLYEEYPNKNMVYLIPSKFVSPFTADEVTLIKQGSESEELEKKMDEAYSIHYFFNAWVK
ncbi:glycosyltransferase family 32 protein [Bacteroides sp.]|uniref:glycosyltransferase family 32 protein n=1 Tax=Bacteroides sp. TaxID=29523 RepID=UPI0026324F37|nr:glycosyltransferase [Bacteroides sp.]MDD3038466.1 glycosyltransferase [Bacteroides sp.]